jgi:hypothetical protein
MCMPAEISWTILLVARSCICIVASYLVLVCKIQVGILKTNQVDAPSVLTVLTFFSDWDFSSIIFYFHFHLLSLQSWKALEVYCSVHFKAHFFLVKQLFFNLCLKAFLISLSRVEKRKKFSSRPISTKKCPMKLKIMSWKLIICKY